MVGKDQYHPLQDWSARVFPHTPGRPVSGRQLAQLGTEIVSVKIQSLVWEHYPTGGGELLTALACADHAHDDGTSIRPAVAYTARKTRQSERAVQMQLSAMRRRGWLLTVRNAGGGRGRATEYRINPLWITNPAEFAPFSKMDKRVQPETEKGAIYDTKGCKAFAPQPPRTIIEPTTTHETGNEHGVVVGHDELKWPSILGGAVQASAMQILQDCPPADRQNVLDEISGLADRNAVRHPIGLLRKLVDRAQHGQFIPAAALEYQRKLESQANAAQSRLAEEQHRQKHSTPQAREVGLAQLAVLRQKFSKKPRS